MKKKTVIICIISAIIGFIGYIGVNAYRRTHFSEVCIPDEDEEEDLWMKEDESLFSESY